MNKVNIYDLLDVYENVLTKNVKNKQKIIFFELKKMDYLDKIKYVLDNNLYDGGYYNIFVIFDPKTRVIMSMRLYDKIINHYITKYILYPKIEKYLLEENCATRKNMGTAYAISKLKKDIEKMKKYKQFYFLKIDIQKFFYSIDHNVLKNKLINILDKDEYQLISKIINSTNHKYINERIKNLENKLGIPLPYYENGKGISLGAVSNQLLAIFYLSDLHNFIKHDLKIKLFTVYMDDYILIHQDKEYLKYVLNKIEGILNTEYKLKVSKNKTFITRMDNGVNFLGYKFIVKNNRTIILLSNAKKERLAKNIKSNISNYYSNKIDFMSLFSAIQNNRYSNIYINSNNIKNILDKYF